MINKRKEKLSNAILNIATAVGAVFMVFSVISVILMEMQILPENFGVTTAGPLGLIPIALFGFSKIADTVTK